MAIPATLPVSPSTVTAPVAHAAPVRSFGAVLEARLPRPHGAAAPDPAPGRLSGPCSGLGERALGALRSVEAAQARLDGLLAAARAGRTFTAQELLALQGEAYRFSQMMELATKLAEQGAQSVKQALHAQV